MVLTADLDEPAARWDLLTFIPLGDAEGELGYKPSRESPVICPNAFSFAPDGSLWIIDAAKQRVAHFTRDGQFLGDVHGVIGSGSRDLVFVGHHLFSMGRHHLGEVHEIEGHRISETHSVRQGRKTVYVSNFIPSPHGLFAQIAGFTEPVATGPIGIYRVPLPGDAQIEEVPGVPLRSGTWFWVTAPDDLDYRLHYLNGDQETVQPVHVKVIASKRHGQRELGGTVGFGNLVIDGNDVYMYAKMSVTKPGSGGDQIGGDFLLRVGESPILFEHLFDPTLPDDTQVRHLALGPDDHIHLMRLDKDGVRIFRR